MSDSIELYYAEMEAHRNDSEERYFEHRTSVDTPENRRMWRAGYERAFRDCTYMHERLATANPGSEPK